MKKSLCLTTYVFGEKYHEYIPILIYSLLKSYPDYYPIIYVREKLKQPVSNILERIRSELGEFRIYEEFFTEYKTCNIQKLKSLRWINDHEEILNFDYAYFVDIDMFYVREEPGLLDQHVTHSGVLNLPYSNIIREFSFVPWKPGNIKERLKMFSFCEALRLGIRLKIISHKLSGLHFVEVKKYFEKLGDTKEEFSRYLFSGKSLTHHKCGFNNECFLYDMIKESGMGLPPVVEDYGPHLLDYRRFNEVGFRPHHGIHLGIFRNKEVLKAYENTLMLDFYVEYYLQYKNLRANDPLFKYILDNSTDFIRKQFDMIDDFYKENLGD